MRSTNNEYCTSLWLGRATQAQISTIALLLRVTCIKWIPGTPNLFLVSYSSGFMYVYNHELVCPPTSPVYQTFLQGEGYSVHTCKTKTTR